MEIAVLYEDERVLAVNKPSGLLVHSAEHGPHVGEETLADWVLSHHPEMAEVGEPVTTSKGVLIPRPGIVHRLDKDTSGVLLLAKTQESFLFLKKSFQERKVRKEYKAIVHGVVKKESGMIDLPIGRSSADFRKKSTLPTARGEKRTAVTRFVTIARAEDASFLSVFPETGRTHQIRVHLKAIGHPVLCDARYAPTLHCPPALGRLALHAFSLELTREDGTVLRLEAPLAEDMARYTRARFLDLRFDK